MAKRGPRTPNGGTNAPQRQPSDQRIDSDELDDTINPPNNNDDDDGGDVNEHENEVGRRRRGAAAAGGALNASTASIGAVLALLIGFFAGQVRELWLELREVDGGGAAINSADTFHGDGRGVARLVFDLVLEGNGDKNGADVTAAAGTTTADAAAASAIKTRAAEVALYVDRNEPFVCRSCMAPASLGGWWDHDENLLRAIGGGGADEAYLPVRVARRERQRSGDCNANDGTAGECTAEDHRATMTQFRRTAAPGSSEIGKGSAYEERNMTATKFFASYMSHAGNDGQGDTDATIETDAEEADPDNSEEHWYAAQIDVVTTLPGLLPYIMASTPPTKQLLDAIGPTPPQSHHPITIYLGSGSRTTQTHYDSLENVVCVASGGTKTFDLFDPAASSKFMYVDRAVHGNGSPVPPRTDASYPLYASATTSSAASSSSTPSSSGGTTSRSSSSDDRSKDDQQHDHSSTYPLSKYALPITVTLHPGDCLYVPVYWYHSVTSSVERTVSINWWRMPDRDKMMVLEGVFCGKADFGAGAKC